jgi:hypothetical protein
MGLGPGVGSAVAELRIGAVGRRRWLNAVDFRLVGAGHEAGGAVG